MSRALPFEASPDAWLHDAKLEDQRWSDVDLSDARLDVLNAMNASLVEASFDGTHFRFPSFHSADLTRASFE